MGQLDDLASSLARQIVHELNTARARRVRDVPESELDAAGWFVRGWTHAQKFGLRDQSIAARCFEQALFMAPGYRSAAAFPSNSLNIIADMSFDQPDHLADLRDRAMSIAETLVLRDPRYSFDLVVQARCYRAEPGIPLGAVHARQCALAGRSCL